MNKPFTIHVGWRKGHFSMPRNHFHDHYEIYYLLAGERYYFITDRMYLITPGNLVLVPKYELHKTADTGSADHERILISFTDEYISSHYGDMSEALLKPFYAGNPVKALNIHEQSFMESLLFKMIREAQSGEEHSGVYVQTLLVQLLIASGRLAGRPLQTDEREPHPMQAKITEAIRFIRLHYARQLNLEEVAGQLFISPVYLSKMFRQLTGFSFVEYVHTVRLKEAQRLLRKTELKIIHISEQVGFGDVSHFGRVFKQVTGLSPLEYRKQTRTAADRKVKR